MDALSRTNAFQARVDGRGIATNVFHVVSNPCYSTNGLERLADTAETFVETTSEGLVRETRVLTNEGRQVERTIFDASTGQCKEVAVTRYSPAADGDGQIRRLYRMSASPTAAVAGCVGGPLAGCGVTEYFKVTDYIPANADEPARNIGWASLREDNSTHRADLAAGGLLWYETDGERDVNWHTKISLVPEKEHDRQEWLLSQR